MSEDKVQGVPSYNPSDATSIIGGLKIFKKNIMSDLECCMPCVVQSYDASSNTVMVLPAIKVATSVGEYVNRGAIKLTAWRFASGGYVIHYPINAGDTGWIIASDVDTSLFKQQKVTSDPNTYFKHKYHFGYFLPDAMNGYNVSSDDNGRLVLQNQSGSEKISIGQSDTKIVSTNLSITATNLNVTGTSKFDGDVTITGDMHSANYDIHTHGGVTSGDSNTGVPNQ